MPRGRRPRLHHEPLACGWHGHFVLGLDAEGLRPEDEPYAREDGDVRWLRCLRCDAWLATHPPEQSARRYPPNRDEVELPLRGKALRDLHILRLIALDRLVHFILLGALAAAIFLFIRHETSLRDSFYKIVADLQPGLRQGQHPRGGLAHELDRIFSLQSGRLHLLGYIVAAYAIIEGVEAVGLWLAKRWAEYLTFIATTALLPLEIFEIATRQSVLKIITFIVNVAVVVYLIYAKRLFGVRGGGAAEERERARDNGWEAIERSAPPARMPTSAPAG